MCENHAAIVAAILQKSESLISYMYITIILAHVDTHPRLCLCDP